MARNSLLILLSLFVYYAVSVIGTGCAQIGMPTGGPKDTLAPVLTSVTPQNRTTRFTGNEVTFNFDEYITAEEMSKNIIISPTLKYPATYIVRPKSLNIRIKDTLKPNTTYTIHLGNAIKDVNEGNIFKDHVLTFTTGNHFDSLRLSGRVLTAETGRPDSTLMLVLFPTEPDSAVLKQKAEYYTFADGQGNFEFINLPERAFRICLLYTSPSPRD